MSKIQNIINVQTKSIDSTVWQSSLVKQLAI